MQILDRRLFLIAAGSALVAGRTQAAEPMLLRDLYNKDLSFSDRAKQLDGARVAVSGFMAPPLKAESTFFVLTKMPMSTCPFCETEAEWPDDILAIYTKRVFDVVPYNAPIVTTGELALGTYTDPETGFLSRVRLTDASVERA